MFDLLQLNAVTKVGQQLLGKQLDERTAPESRCLTASANSEVPDQLVNNSLSPENSN